MQLDWPILSVLIWLPIAAGALLLLIGDRNAPLARWLALGASVLTFVISLLLWNDFDTSTGTMQFVEQKPWIGAFNAWYTLGVDGISMPLIVLTAFITPLVVIAGWTVIEKRPAQYLAAFLILEGLMIGVFAALDALLFYVLWEAMLIPMFVIIGVWGGPRRVYATIKFFLYTFLGSVLMLVALIYMYLKGGSYAIADLQALPLTMREQVLIFTAFLLAFAVKVPMWPVHTWLPDAHVEAPTGGSVILAAIMLKMGGYGFLRFSLPITPDAARELDWLVITLSLTAVVYIGFVALVQQDMKKLIAYSSIAHMGFVTLGSFIAFDIVRSTGGVQGAAMGLDGAMVQMVSHGLVSGALFLCIGVLYDRVHSRQIADYGGVINTMPIFGAFMVLFAMANAGLPGTSGFVGEFLVILASFKANFWYAFLAAVTLILGAAYTLWLVKRVVFGPIGNEHVAQLKDVNGREFLVLGVLAVAVLALGLWPAPLLAATCVVLLGDLFLKDKDRWITFALSLLTLAGVAWITAATGFSERTVGWHGTYVADPLSSLLKIVACGAVAVAFLYGHAYLQVRNILKGEYYVLGLFALLGIMVLVSANSLVTLYLGVELLALSLYALVAFDRDSGIAAESAIKYFVLGSIASGALLYGMSIIYGVTGSLELGVVSNAAMQMEAGQIGLLFGLAFIVVGVAFKFGAVPFHTWVPDVYHGAPTPVTLFLAAAPKLGSFALAFRLLAEGLGPVHATGWQDMITLVAVASIVVGNVVAIAQTNIKRMLAYSTISHVGFILFGILAGTSEGYEAALYYTITYVIMSVGGFGMIILLSRQGFEADSLDDFKGLNARSPWFAAVMLMLMFSMAGVPPFVGFWAKLAVIQAVLHIGSLWLAIVAVAFSVVGAYYYLRVVKLMYFDEPTERVALQGGGGAMRVVLSLNGLAVLALGLFPGMLLALCARVIP